jgi:hypothetical protein
MDTPAYDIVFSGAVLAGRDPSQVRAELARLFKTDAAGIARLFCGQPVIIKKGVDRRTADKYQAALEKAGAACEIRARASTGRSADIPPHMSVAPAGTVLTTSNPVKPPVFDLGHMSLAATGVDILEGVESVVVPPQYDLTAFSVAPPGSELVTENRPQPAPLPDIGAWSVAEPGSDLDTRGPAAAVALPDISGMTLAPAGTAVIRPEEMKPQRGAPDSAANHLTIAAAPGSTR